MTAMAIPTGSDLFARLHVEGWSPDYGAPIEVPEDSAPTSPIDPTVETRDWRPIAGSDERAPAEVVFVDGVRRVEARLTLDDPLEGPVPGIMGAFGVGGVLWERNVPRSTFAGLHAERIVAMARGYQLDLPHIGGIPVTTESVPGDEPSELVAHLQRRMRAVEQSLAASLARGGRLVVADGRIRELRPMPIVGFIKTHQVMYLPAGHRRLIGSLAAGQRTPLFSILTENFPRYSWYLRLADMSGGHSWTGIVRCEVSASVGKESAVGLAGWTSALLPRLASERHIDPRAPQNLVPIAALEKELRKRLGDQRMAHRFLSTAVRSRTLSGVGGGR